MSVETITRHILSSDFWRGFNIGHVAVIGVALIGFGRMQQKFEDLSNVQAQQAAIISSMNKEGTVRSHETDATQQKDIDDLNRRVTNLESISRDLVPKVERIDANVISIMSRNANR